MRRGTGFELPSPPMISIVMWIKLHSQLWLLVHSSLLVDSINANHDWDFSDGGDSLMWEKSCKVAAFLIGTETKITSHVNLWKPRVFLKELRLTLNVW
jgi:hypothetical protein